MFEVLRTNCDGVCAGNWGRKEKRAMGFDIPHRTLAQRERRWGGASLEGVTWSMTPMVDVKGALRPLSACRN